MLRNDLATPLPDTYMPDMVVAVEEKRVQSRRRVLKSEKIVFAHGTCLLDCTIRNISEKGAMLQIDNSVSVPDEFQLYRPSGMFLHDVRVVGRANGFIGVAITATRNIAESVYPRLRRLRLMR